MVDPLIVGYVVACFVVVLALVILNKTMCGPKETQQQQRRQDDEELIAVRLRILEMRQAMSTLEDMRSDLESQERIDEMRSALAELEVVASSSTTTNTRHQPQRPQQSQSSPSDLKLRQSSIKKQFHTKILEDLDSIRSIQHSLEFNSNSKRKASSSRSFVSSLRSWGSKRSKHARKPTTTDVLECSICLCDYQARDIVAWPRNTDCNHVFHEDCITEWLKEHDECPLCRCNLMNS